jgi:predicted permease
VNVRAVRVTGNLFGLLGARAARGRLLDVSDDSGGQNAVAIVSDEFWRGHLSRDPGLVGRVISVDGIPTTVIGILPPEFQVPHGNNEATGDLWVPMRFTAEERAHRGHNFLEVIGRLAPGATVAAADFEVKSLVDDMIRIYPELKGESARALALQAESVRLIRTPLLFVFGAVCAVLLIAAANVGSLLLARGVQRQHETAVRSALGADRWAVMRPVLAECVVLTAIGGLLGVGLAWVAVRAIGELAIAQLPQLAGIAIEVRIVIFALSLSAIVALLCSALPAWNSATVDPQDALRGGRGGSAGSAHQRGLGGLVVAEVALSLMLLIAGSLVLRGFSKLVGRNPGFDPQPLLTLTATVSPTRYGDTKSISQFLRPALDAIEQLPGVQSAGAISHLPYREWGSNSNIRYEGQPNIDMEHFPLADDRTATPDFFKTTGQRLIAGRFLRWDDDDRPGAPIVVVANEALVRRDFPDQNPIGKRFYAGMSDSTFVTIVGVVSDIPNAGPIDPPVPEVYWSYAQSRSDTWFNIVVRAARGDPVAIEKSVSAAIHTVDPQAAVSEVEPMREVMAKSVGTPRFYLTLIGTFALVAVILAVAGLYGVMSYVVAQRTREIGIRTALGSTSSRTLGLVVRSGMRLLGVGVLGGVVGGALVTRVLASLLYGVSPADAPTWILATLALVTAGAVAAAIPAARAARVDPIIAIRAEQ